MKVIKTGAFFIDSNPDVIDRQLSSVYRIMVDLQNKYGSDVVLTPGEDVVKQIAQLYVQTMSVKRIPLLITPSDDHGLIVNNINLNPKVKLKTDADLFKYLKTLSNYRIVDIQGVSLEIDELIQLIKQTKHTIRLANLGKSLINNSNVAHDENDILINQYQQSDWTTDTYVISFPKSIQAAQTLFDQIDHIQDMVLPASADVIRDLSEYLILNYRIQFLKIANDKVPVLYLPDLDDTFGVFDLLKSKQTIIEQWHNRKFTTANRDELTKELLDNSKFDGDDLTKMHRLPVTDDPSGKSRQLIKGHNKDLNDGYHYFDVILVHRKGKD